MSLKKMTIKIKKSFQIIFLDSPPIQNKKIFSLEDRVGGVMNKVAQHLKK